MTTSRDIATGPRTIGVALLGLGNVGGGVVKLLADNAAAIEARLGARLEVRAIAVRDPDKAQRVVEVDRALLDHRPRRRDPAARRRHRVRADRRHHRCAKRAVLARDRGRQARRHRQQGAARRARRRDLRRRRGARASTSTTRRRCAAACRSSACCARASRRDRVEAIVRHRQRHLELHPVDDDRDRAVRSPTSCARPRRSATPRPIRRSTSAAATPRTSSRSWSSCASARTVDVAQIPTDGIERRRADRPRRTPRSSAT